MTKIEISRYGAVDASSSVDQSLKMIVPYLGLVFGERRRSSYKFGVERQREERKDDTHRHESWKSFSGEVDKIRCIDGRPSITPTHPHT